MGDIKIKKGRTESISPETRRRVIERDNKCIYCGKEIAIIIGAGATETMRKWRAYDNNGLAFHFDHKIPYCQGGASDETNIVLACAKCNLRRPKKAK